MKRCLSLLLVFALALGVICLAPAAPPAVAAGKKLVAITYDDGPGAYTNNLLDGLKARGVKATFFMVGTNVAGYSSVVSRVYQEGHQVANHSYNHANLTSLSAAGVQSQLQTVNAMLDKVCGKGTSYMVRAPYGSVNSTVRNAAGAPLISWSVDPLDWKYRNSGTVKNNIIRQAHDGAIILVHDIHATSIPGSLAAIDYLQSQGYEFVTVRELFRRRGQTPQSGVQYNKVAPNGKDLGPVEKPTITSEPEGDKLRITITAQSGAAIYYTITNSLLNQESPRYTESFLVSPPCTVKAVAAFNMNGSRSDEVSETFTMPLTAVPQLSVKNGLLTAECATPGAEIYYALQGGEFQQYTAPINIEPSTEISAYAKHEGYLDSSAVKAHYSAEGNLFRDVFPQNWYYEDLDKAVAAGFITGEGNGFYLPENRLQRGELITMLYRYSGEHVSAEAMAALPFTDVPKDAYYAEAVAWAYDKGIVSGDAGGVFLPQRFAERQEMCSIFLRYLQASDVILQEGSSSADKYADGQKIALWAYHAVGIMTDIGLLSGEENGMFNPTAGSTRAQAAAVLTRLTDFVDKNVTK